MLMPGTKMSPPPALTCLCFIEQHNSRLETQYNYLKVIDGSHEEQEEEFGLNLIPYFPNPTVFVCFFFFPLSVVGLFKTGCRKRSFNGLKSK